MSPTSDPPPAPERPAGKLAAYRKKRDPDRTIEPFGGAAAEGGCRFVVHQHAARNLHWDLRLELEGVLKSWAVPKGPSTHVEEKRLAVHVEDHPIEYGDFEGVIPPGNYGAGSVIIWDRGWYRSFKPEALLDQYRQGKLELELFGFKLRGRWTLVKMTRNEKEWLLLKKAGAGASEHEMVERYPQSVLSGLTVEERADPRAKLESIAAAVEALGAPRRDVTLRAQKPMLATLDDRPFDGAGWLFEIKYDGVRVLARRQGETVEMLGRSGQPITHRYPEITTALLALPADDFLLDGEIVCADESGRPSFQRLQRRMLLTKPPDVARAMLDAPVNAVFFDAPALLGHDLRGVPLIDRKRCLERLLPPLGTVSYGGHVEERGVAFFEAASKLRLEGIVAKQAKSLYTGQRSKDWLKIKCQRRQDFVIGGWTDPQGGRGGFGALHIGLHRDGRLIYVTKVGTGFDQAMIDAICARMATLAREQPPFEGAPKGRGHHWVEPKLVCEVRFTEWTRDGGLRHPTFLGLRDDIAPAECRFEDEPARPAASAAERVEVAPAEPKRLEVTISNARKVFFPEHGYTKGDLVAYYETIAPWMLPYLKDRPIFVTRYPDGIHGKSFYQKDAPVFAQGIVRTVPIASEEGENRYFVIDDVETLKYVINLGTIPIHPWSSRAGSLERPDWMIVDLDPKEAPFAHVIRVAKTLHGVLDELELPHYIKTSGATGLHVLVPLGARYTYEQSRGFARVLATLVVEREPEIATVVRAVQARGGKVYVDFGQNGYGQSIVAPFCVRPRPGAPVSCPLVWDEVNDHLDPAAFTIRTVPVRFAKMKDPLLPVLGPGIRMDEALERLGKLLKG